MLKHINVAAAVSGRNAAKQLFQRMAGRTLSMRSPSANAIFLSFPRECHTAAERFNGCVRAHRADRSVSLSGTSCPKIDRSPKMWMWPTTETAPDQPLVYAAYTRVRPYRVNDRHRYRCSNLVHRRNDQAKTRFKFNFCCCPCARHHTARYAAVCMTSMCNMNRL